MPDSIPSVAPPLIRFMLGGVQKGGTTALAHYLSSHPDLALPCGKEAHVFDAPEFDERWNAQRIDSCFAPHFAPGNAARLHGDATPITVFHPALVGRVARYNPTMRWVILLRDPVERAVSHYFMERGRGLESRSLLAAALLERHRLRGHGGDWSPDSPLRVCSYVARSRYTRQLDVLFHHFPRDQVLLLRSQDLAQRRSAVLAQVCAFLGVAALPAGDDQLDRVFAGVYRAPRPWSPGRLALRWMLRGEKPLLARRHGVVLD